jgi:hypothetical protein
VRAWSCNGRIEAVADSETGPTQFQCRSPTNVTALLNVGTIGRGPQSRDYFLPLVPSVAACAFFSRPRYASVRPLPPSWRKLHAGSLGMLSCGLMNVIYKRAQFRQ